MADGNIFYIKSRMNGKVLDVRRCSSNPGTQVIMFDQKGHNCDNQLWYEDPATGTIRSKFCNHCLDIEDGNTLVINEYSEGNENQQWTALENYVRNRADNNRVFDIAGSDPESGAKVCAWDFHGNDNQAWDFEYQPPRYFFIKSQMNGKVLDVKGAEDDEGADVITYDQHDDPQDNQLWYQDRRGFIRSKMNDMIWDSSDDKIEMAEYEEGKDAQMWCPVFSENKIVNPTNPGVAIDIKGAKRRNSAKIIPYEWHGNSNQLWDFEFID